MSVARRTPSRIGTITSFVAATSNFGSACACARTNSRSQHARMIIVPAILPRLMIPRLPFLAVSPAVKFRFRRCDFIVEVLAVGRDRLCHRQQENRAPVFLPAHHLPGEIKAGLRLERIE